MTGSTLRYVPAVIDALQAVDRLDRRLKRISAEVAGFGNVGYQDVLRRARKRCQ